MSFALLRTAGPSGRYVEHDLLLQGVGRADATPERVRMKPSDLGRDAMLLDGSGRFWTALDGELLWGDREFCENRR